MGIFVIGRRVEDEDQLTEMLAWLGSVVRGVALTVVKLAMPDLKVDADVLRVSTQVAFSGGRFDAVFTAGSLVLVVESKLGSTYGHGQLRKYLRWLDKQSDTYAERCLMTLTADDAPWPAEDIAYADAIGVRSASRRWEELHDGLAAITMGSNDGDLRSQLVEDFREMLEREGLVPVKPLDGDELVDAWSRSKAIVGHYHEYFRACTSELAVVLDAEPHSRTPASTSYVYQAFKIATGDLIEVGLSADTGDRMKTKLTPIVWLAVDGSGWPNWDSAIRHLEQNPPEGWRKNVRWWGRPCVWRYLDEVIEPSSFKEQRAQFANACRCARTWLESARPEHS